MTELTPEQKKKIDGKVISAIVNTCLLNEVKFEQLSKKTRGLLIDMFQTGMKFQQDIDTLF